MARDVTLFGIDVNEATVRRVLEALPGVEPLPVEGEGSDGTHADAADPDDHSGEAVAGDEATAGTVGAVGDAVADRNGADGEGGSSAGDGRADDHARTGPAGAPDTPWPGAPFESEDESGGRNWKRLLLGVGLVLGLGLVGVGAVLALRKWRSRESGDGADVGDVAEDANSVDARDADENGAGSTDGRERTDDERSPPMNAAPVVGTAFLAGATVLIERFYGAGD